MSIRKKKPKTLLSGKPGMRKMEMLHGKLFLEGEDQDGISSVQ